MSLTRAAVEAEIVEEIGPRMAFVGMSTTTNGENSSLNGPIRRALADMGFPTAAPLLVADGDLDAFWASGTSKPARNAWRLEKLITFACMNVLQSILFKTTDVDWKAGVDEVKAHQFVEDLRKDLERMEAKAAAPYGPDVDAAIITPMAPDPLHMPNDPFDSYRSRSRPGRWPYS